MELNDLKKDRDFSNLFDNQFERVFRFSYDLSKSKDPKRRLAGLKGLRWLVDFGENIKADPKLIKDLRNLIKDLE